jgi:hypothetical protein
MEQGQQTVKIQLRHNPKPVLETHRCKRDSPKVGLTNKGMGLDTPGRGRDFPRVGLTS